jgi:queuine/archaeosine tRNA-ribosyltransferase
VVVAELFTPVLMPVALLVAAWADATLKAMIAAVVSNTFFIVSSFGC